MPYRELNSFNSHSIKPLDIKVGSLSEVARDSFVDSFVDWVTSL